ncbi:MAG: tryptophan-rich sensory protein [Clostridia bacterium]|nr:tryptophan-rich sensory protein [Clostridia bacterium]
MLKKLKKFWSKIKPYALAYLVAIAIPLTVGIVAAALTRDSMDIYGRLNTPPLAPPSALFPIVWTALYILMGISSAMIYQKRNRYPEAAKNGLIYYGVSLVLNFSWSIIFFRLQAAFFALIVLIALLYTIIKTILEYRKVCPIAAYLQIPYAIWIIFAGYLNAGIWLLN